MAKKQSDDTFEIWGGTSCEILHSVRIFSSKPAVHARRV